MDKIIEVLPKNKEENKKYIEAKAVLDAVEGGIISESFLELIKKDLDNEEVVEDEFKPEDHPRNKLGMFIKKIGDILFSKKDKKEESNNLSGDYIANVYLSETGDLNYGLPTKKEIRGFLEKEELPDNLEDLDKLYDDIDLLNDEYYLKGDLTKYAIEYKKSLIVDKIKRLNKEKEDLMRNVLKNTLKKVPKSEFDYFK